MEYKHIRYAFPFFPATLLVNIWQGAYIKSFNIGKLKRLPAVQGKDNRFLQRKALRDLEKASSQRKAKKINKKKKLKTDSYAGKHYEI